MKRDELLEQLVDILSREKEAYRPAVEPRESQAWEENGFLFSFHAENRSRL